MGNAEGKEQSLTTRILNHTLAFKENSVQLYYDAVTQVKLLVSGNGSLYPPTHFPRIREPYPESTIRLSPDSIFDGRLSQAEAVGVVFC